MIIERVKKMSLLLALEAVGKMYYNTLRLVKPISFKSDG